jgi:hypothetical protein
MKSRILGLLAVGLLAAPMAEVGAAQVEVSYSISGTAGNWLLNFSVTNNVSSVANVQYIEFLGFRLPARNIAGTPSGGWDPDAWPSWDNTSWGGSGTFNNNWFGGQIAFGSTVSGFQVMVATADAPGSVDWFAFAHDPKLTETYTGSFDETVYDSLREPGFEGTAVPRVAEPGTLALLGLGLMGLGLTRRKAA